jgi:tetratricopeptide (TPR) repeat protein
VTGYRVINAQCRLAQMFARARLRLVRPIPSGIACVLIATMTLGCAGARAGKTPGTADSGALGPIIPVDVNEADFARSAYRVLVSSEPSEAHASLLAGVVKRQLARATLRFRAERPESGLEAVKGAFFLMRRGDFRIEAFQGAPEALSNGAAETARLGLEGYSLALYSLLMATLPEGKARADVKSHLDAMSAFRGPSQDTGPLATLGADARSAVQRALFESTEASFADASGRLLGWLERTQASDLPDMPVRSNADRYEALEVFRAVRGGGLAIAALYLRHGDPLGALTAMDEAGVERLVPRELRSRLEATGEDDDPGAWADLYRLYETASQETQSEFGLDPEALSGAAWGSALGLFRSEPGSLRGAFPLASELVAHGMAEVAPLVLASALARGGSAEELSIALALVLNAMVSEAEAKQHQGARRTFEGARELLDLASNKRFLGHVNPSAARLRYAMAALEVDQGELDRALPLLRAVVASEPLSDALRLLAAIERQRGRLDDALKYTDDLATLFERAGNSVEQAEALRSRFEILRDRRDVAGANAALSAALNRALDAARQNRPGAAGARAERLLARVLEHYGETAAVRRATERAFNASASDARELGATAIDSARGAFTRGDLQAARQAVQRAVEGSLPPEDTVYLALWLRLLEQKLKIPSDGSVEGAFASMDGVSGWLGRLRAWGRGRISDAELIAQAKTASERTEATFYTAMSRRLRGDASANAELQRVTGSPAVNLVEIGIARDVLALDAGHATFTLPKGTALP